ncbi:MAG: hypothetical protein ABI790_04945, partial [Betaproteobacteria bacterium]
MTIVKHHPAHRHKLLSPAWFNGEEFAEEKRMKTHDMLEQFTHGMGDPKQVGEWLKTAWPMPTAPDAAAAPARVWIGSLESMLKGAEALRHMQLDAIHRVQERTTRLARSLGEAQRPADTVTALQSFSQENAVDAIKYWSAYREIVRDAEVHLLQAPGLTAGTGKAPSRGMA